MLGGHLFVIPQRRITRLFILPKNLFLKDNLFGYLIKMVT